MSKDGKQEVDEFLERHIDTVPHLEALLLLWNSRPRKWSIEEVAKALFVTTAAAASILDDLVRERLMVHTKDASIAYHYEPGHDADRVVGEVDASYRRELIRISRLIHSKPPAAVRDFARAFRLKKEED